MKFRRRRRRRRFTSVQRPYGTSVHFYDNFRNGDALSENINAIAESVQELVLPRVPLRVTFTEPRYKPLLPRERLAEGQRENAKELRKSHRPRSQ